METPSDDHCTMFTFTTIVTDTEHHIVSALLPWMIQNKVWDGAEVIIVKRNYLYKFQPIAQTSKNHRRWYYRRNA